jgi:hypothetical protein
MAAPLSYFLFVYAGGTISVPLLPAFISRFFQLEAPVLEGE